MPGNPVVLDSFGGLVTTARPEDLPEGASPRNNDVDFVVGRFIQRPGCQSVYTLAQAEYGPNGGASATVIDTILSPWVNPANILLDNETYATTTLAGPSAANYAVQSMAITTGGYYTLSETPVAELSGLGAGAIFSFSVGTITPPVGDPYNTVTGVTVLTGGIYTGPVAINFFGASAGNNAAVSVTMQPLASTLALSNILQVTGFSLPITDTYQINGIGVNVRGFAPAGATVFAQLLKAGVPVGDVESLALPATNGYVALGSPINLWLTTWPNTDTDSPGFGVNLWVGSESASTVSLDYVEIVVYGTPKSANFNGIGSVNLNQTDQTTLTIDANGLTWKEDASNNPGILYLETGIPAVMVDSFLKAIDANGVAFMAYSDLTQGTSQPMQYNGAWCDRITQVGPGAPPVFTPQQTTSDSFSITQITQPVAATYGYIYFLQSTGPGSTAPGNVITIYYSDSTNNVPNADLVAAMATGYAVYLYLHVTGIPVPYGPITAQITSIGEASPPGQPRQFYYFTFVVSGNAATYYQGSGHAGYTVNFQRTLATMQMAEPVPGLTIDNQVTISGNSQTGYNNVWPIAQTIDSGAMAITATQVLSGVAYYQYALTSGANPTTSELVTVTNTTNALGDLNVTNSVIASVTGGSTGFFTINVPIAIDYPGYVPESAQATTEGTLFAFDPGIPVVNTSTSPIFGTGTGGSLIFEGPSGQFITPGTKQGSVFFITRNGAVTRPAPTSTFVIPSNCGAILCAQIPLGPPNVVARGITFTESGQNGVAGANFYYYDTPVSFYVNGIKYTSDALIVPDNTSTTATFSFSDAVLLASDEIDILGNDYFNLIELGNPAWIFQYANRMLYGLCQTKIQNFLNLSFDGGYLPTGSTALPMPTGWNALSTSTGIGLVQSLDFGNAFRITNYGTEPWTDAQVLFQSAFQDYLNVNIIQPNTSYSVRVKARSIYADGQTVTLQLPTYANGAFLPTVSGSASFTFNQGNYEIQTAPLITGNGLATVPTALQIALGVSALSVGAGVEIDRIEIFPTNRPVDTATIWTSYAGKFESVDINTGTLGVGADNAQAATGAFEILEQLYIEKSKSLCVTQDSPNYEPNNWQVRLASDRAGAVGPNAFNEGEEFAVSASRNGVYYFDGGKPQPILRELQNSAKGLNLWESINWEAGATIWIRNDLNNRRLMIGIPMITPNPWLPLAAAATPTSPNIILMCNYTGCPTGAEMADGSEVHVTMFGDLKALDMRRKWSLWQIPCPVAEFVPRTDGFTTPIFLCNGNASGKIYQLLPGAADGSGQNTDDGAAINWSYTTCGFVKGKAGQQVQGLGALRKIAYYFTATMEGIGQVAGKLYANSLGALGRNTFTIPLPFTLSSPQQNDQERTLEFGAQRIFVEFSSIGSGGYAEIGPVTLDMEADKNSPHRGVSA